MSSTRLEKIALLKYLQFVLLLLGVETAQFPATTADVDNDGGRRIIL
jgi:hypothetical protein